MSDPTCEDDCCDAVLFVDSHLSAQLISHLSAQLITKGKRNGIVARWVQARREGKDERQARREAVAGLSFPAAILAHVIVKLLIKWWDQRSK